MDTIQSLIQQLEATKGDTQAQAALTAEFTLMNFPETVRSRLHESLDAAAVLRGFNAELLSHILEIPQNDVIVRLDTLTTFPFVEQYRRGKEVYYNLHETTRLGWRKQLYNLHPDHFCRLSLSAATLFTDDFTPTGRIEWIYHLLCGSPEQAATELEKLDREWISQASPEDYYALASAIQELETTKLISGRARVWALLVIAWARDMRGETAQLTDIGAETLALAREYRDSSAEAQANSLLGDALQAQGQLEQAQAAFNQGLSISRRLAEQDPSNAGWQRELAVAHSRVGDILNAQGQLEQAQAAFNQYLTISRRLAEQDPSNAGWQRDLAVANSRVGDILQAQGKLEQAQAAFNQDLSISRRLAEQDPSNAGWQRDLTVAQEWVDFIQKKLESNQN